MRRERSREVYQYSVPRDRRLNFKKKNVIALAKAQQKKKYTTKKNGAFFVFLSFFKLAA